MKYVFLKDEDQNVLVLNRIRELEAHHFALSLEEDEEPGKSPVRARSLADLERRISNYHASLNMTGESPERVVDPVVEP